jgi:hypothetical protein
MLRGFIRDPNFPLYHVQFKVEAGKIITAIETKGIHDVPRDTRPKLVFQFNQRFLIDLIPVIIKNPMKMHV